MCMHAALTIVCGAGPKAKRVDMAEAAMEATRAQQRHDSDRAAQLIAQLTVARAAFAKDLEQA